MKPRRLARPCATALLIQLGQSACSPKGATHAQPNATASPPASIDDETNTEDRTGDLHLATVRARREALEHWKVEFPLGKDKQLYPPLRTEPTGLPPWPMREAFVVLSTPSTTIFATDGLSDPFSDEASRIDGRSGFGVELWIETDERTDDAAKSWLPAVIGPLSYQVAGRVFGRDEVDRHGMFSFELHVDDMQFSGKWPARFVSAERTVGVLIGVGPSTRSAPAKLPAGDVRYCGVLLLDAAQLSLVRAKGEEAAKAIAAEGWISRVHP